MSSSIILPPPVPFTSIVPMPGNEMLLYPFLTEKSANLFFGDGSSTKSYLCIHVAVSMVSGLPFLGFKPKRKCNVMFLDYEDVEGKFGDRVARICGGMTEKPAIEDLANLYYQKANAPLSSIVSQLKERIKEHNIELIIIDSAAYACGMEIEKADAVIRYFNALGELDIASLAIAHVTKSSSYADDRLKGQNHAIGSIYFNNAPRNTWNIIKQGDENDAEKVKKVCLFHRKCNDAPLHRLIPAEVDFSKETVTAIRVGKESDWEESRSLAGRILSLLETGMRTRSEIDREFEGENKATIKRTLQRLKNNAKISQINGEGSPYILGTGGHP